MFEDPFDGGFGFGGLGLRRRGVLRSLGVSWQFRVQLTKHETLNSPIPEASQPVFKGLGLSRV